MILQFGIRRELPAALAERTLLDLLSTSHGHHGVDGTLGLLCFLVQRAVHPQFLPSEFQHRRAFRRLFRLRIDHRWHRLLLFCHGSLFLALVSGKFALPTYF